MAWDDPGLDQRDSERLWRASMLHKLGAIERWLNRLYTVGVVANIVLIAMLLQRCSA